MNDRMLNAVIRFLQKKPVIRILSLPVFWSSKTRKKLRDRLSTLANHRYIAKVQNDLAQQLKNKQIITAVFLGVDNCLWPYDSLYALMEAHPRFSPVVVVIPHASLQGEYQRATYIKTLTFFKEKGFRVLSSWNEETQHYMRLEHLTKPDVIFYTSPYDISLPQYNIRHWYDRALTCYVPYGIMQANIQHIQYNQLFHNIVWRCFYETKLHEAMAHKYARNKGRNVVVTGYPKMDVFLRPDYLPKEAWPKARTTAKRIIWAPHYTIEDGLNFSNFLEYAQFFIDLLAKYPEGIHIAFKPHPNLRAKLYKHKDWGPEKTDTYYALWNMLPNGQLEEGDYIDLFLTSDALIHDSVSFIAEYTYLDKPMLFMLRDPSVKQKFNEFGAQLFETVNTSLLPQEVIHFVELVLAQQPDPKQAARHTFVKDFLKQPIVSRGKTASENIMDYLDNIVSAKG